MTNNEINNTQEQTTGFTPENTGAQSAAFSPGAQPAQAPPPEQSQSQWARQQAQNPVLQTAPAPSVPTPPKRKADAVKWIAIALAVLFALTTVLSFVTRSTSGLNGATLTGTVTAVDGNRITLSLEDGKSGFFSGPMNGQDSRQMQGTPPEMQSGENEQSAGENEQSTDENNTAANGQSDASQQQGTLPQQPGNGQNSPNDFGNAQREGEKQNAAEITLKIGSGTKITGDSDTASASDIAVGDTVTVSFGSFGNLKSLTVTSADNTTGATQPGSAPNNDFWNNAQPPQSDSSEQSSDTQS